MPITGPTHNLEQAKKKWKEVTILVHQPHYFDHSFRVPQPDLHPDFCDEVLQSLTELTTYNTQYPTNQETYQLPDQTYQLPDQHHEYPTSTTNTTDQPSCQPQMS